MASDVQEPIFQKTGTWYENLAIDFSSHFLIKDSRPVRHYLLIEKKFPFKRKYAFSLGTGFVWDSKRKYGNISGTDSKSELQIIIRPNIEF